MLGLQENSEDIWGTNMARIKMIICDGGVSKDFLDIRPQKECEHFMHQGHDVEVIILYRDSDKNIPYRTNINNIRCVFLNCRGIATNWIATVMFKNKTSILYPFWFMVFVYKLKAYLNNNPAEFLHCHNMYGTIAGCLVKGRNQKLIFDMREFFGMQGDLGVLAMIKKRVSKYLCKKSDRILYVHPLQKEEAPLETQYKFFHLPNYPDTGRIVPLKKERISEVPLYISYIGEIRKKQKVYFEILAKACAEAGDVKLFLHGGGNGYPDVLYLQEKYPNAVRVTGTYNGVTDTARLFSECDLLYCCYDISVLNWKRAEPIKMFEAIATKTPFVVSKGAYVESFVTEKNIGYVLDGGEYYEVLSFIRYIKDHREELELKASKIEEIMGQYTWNNVVGVLDEAYL